MNKNLTANSNYVLRKVLNKEEYLDIIKDFIEAILGIDIKEIELNPYLEKRSQYLPKEEKFGIADVRIKTNDDEEINVGIQFLNGMYIETKILMYYAQIHLNQLEYDKKREFAKTITINFLDFIHFSSPKYHQIIKIASNEENIKLEELEIHTIELPKITFVDQENMSKQEQWITYLNGCDDDTLLKIKNNNESIKLLDKLVEKYWREEKME